MTDSERIALEGTVETAGGVSAFNLRPADTSEFKGLRPLHGDVMIYLRLLLPKLLPDADTILYLDSDLVVDVDVCPLFEHSLGDAAVAAVDGPTVHWAFDHEFLRLAGLGDEDRHFNSGVLLMNAALWRKAGLMEKCLGMARDYADVLISHDQSVLVALFSRSFSRLPSQFNCELTSIGAPITDTRGIFHFVGSPKPWDPFGCYVHGNWKIWHDEISRTRFRWSEFLLRHPKAYLKRAWSLRRSYLRTFRRKLGEPA